MKMPKKLHDFLSRVDEQTAQEIDEWLVEDSVGAWDEMRDALADVIEEPLKSKADYLDWRQDDCDTAYDCSVDDALEEGR